MKITHVEADSYVIPVELPRFPEPVKSDCVVCRVHTDQGITGVGATHRVNRFACRENIRRELGPWLAGKDPLATERLWDQMFWKFNQRRMTGVWTAALSAVDIALWDIKGKALGQPVYKLLGNHSGEVAAYCTFGMLEYGREEQAELAAGLVRAGWSRIKMKVCVHNSTDIPEDAARVMAVREAVGGDAEIMMDANHLFSLMQAKELARRCEPYGVRWFEEPVAGNDVKDLVQLRASTTIPIAAGQQEGMRWRHRDLIAGGAVDIAQPDVVFVGGYTEGVKVAHLAQAYNLPIATHGWPHLNMHLAGAVSNGWRMEYHLEPAGLDAMLFKDPPVPERGVMRIPDKPGLGLDFNEERVRPYRDT
ncbi:MAG: mandelate racemase/muconate lactonizing enzyme family protein [Candidatus Tectomicrobia bacterium]|uniref:Mandelate racemase/muconate lactonizing enzyme family protein n=1 Tax=Tectimicrobiota bacterium TaxID=2528274 RepID=A0A933EA45_UNCTE|nr:mandelate racemase/muconate lactonizing enzyme family protein [Candidatus Tectomicrobia bacterium]MBI4252235.1 mandelate racemase/muconate lactonizing enzyme family protein [Candidatus Tectomicrobia bacterium]